MKKIIWTILLVILFVTVNTGAAWAGSAIELISVTNNGGGPSFTFRVSGEFSPSQLKGSGHINGGDDFEMDCVQKDETTVVCHAPAKAGGQGTSVTFGGSTFWTNVPEQRIASGGGSTQYCYGVWANKLAVDVKITSYYSNGNPESIDYTPPWTNYGWQDYGPHCQDEPGVPLSAYDYFILDTSNGKTFVAFWNSAFCGSDHGPAYYSIYC